MNRGAPSAAEIDTAVCRYVELDGPALRTQAALLSPQERERAGRLRFPVDRDRFVAAHIALRLALAEQGAQQADALRLADGPLGKPWLPDHPRIHFSLSHSRGVALIAVGHRGPLGVDVEYLRPVPDALAVAERCFTLHENRALRSLPPRRRGRAFLTCWTRKEACLKAIGLGLRLDPSTIEVGLEATLRRIDIPVGGHLLRVVVGPAPARSGSVASLAEWRIPQPLLQVPGALAQAARAFGDAAAYAAAPSRQRLQEAAP
ncbi:4'-phosphopantetheinyl transferase family protein [Xylophilus sp.]|uniref:4'-phosphopantetheinyl transferase family protein n=1 Tax=Xylophilus sp. TaxID=2653893 RepID=UPI0013BBBCAB|nr:4'-phosphopantetheinyl transferase superfamily protein [Xylophilus sp.]KAF1048056.1 MAG: 4'-phosphopantetheinyl transferase Sfp [Xylophilus sp.]